MTRKQAKVLADRITTELFTTYRGDPATRLISVTELAGNKAKVADAINNGGYCQEAVRDVIIRYLLGGDDES